MNLVWNAANGLGGVHEGADGAEDGLIHEAKLLGRVEINHRVIDVVWIWTRLPFLLWGALARLSNRARKVAGLSADEYRQHHRDCEV
jgi:hypothetical protein